ncbi:phosphate ABC transporter substrate-binding protein [Thalassobaculum fulvum]|uniref:Phosphate ABC transporter substrate-binding protein n=1 Tax=Thalassobaculum fulvum TaxID=1633335 RepID=A0A918XNP0_9PROT|nr:PstS family phosphate ABC transporter substrate-binding protein [Thalassobaculum fulvum]GHD39878.1 phosphate ABC transporter substrate-binding protein [Thalassobaculum fulvum]
MTTSFGKVAAIAALGVFAMAAQAEARDQIRIVGSSTVFPFATVVAENFGKSSGFKTPVIESTGSGGGLKLFCQGVGTEHPDITNSSRRIKKSEVELCGKNGVESITEIKIGFDGIVLANSKKAPHYTLTREQIFLALAKEVPVDGKLVANPYTKWSQIDKSLPDEDIEVLGPPPTSGTRDAFVELVMEHAAEQLPVVKDLKKSDKKRFKQVFGSMREDGKFIEAGENDNLIVQKLEANPHALGIFGFSFLDQNSDKIQGSTVEGADPTFDKIADGSYPVSRSLFFYVKNAHVGVIPGIKEYIAEFTADKANGQEGYLTDKGLIPLPEAERKKYEEAGATLTKLVL